MKQRVKFNYPAPGSPEFENLRLRGDIVSRYGGLLHIYDRGLLLLPFDLNSFQFRYNSDDFIRGQITIMIDRPVFRTCRLALLRKYTHTRNINRKQKLWKRKKLKKQHNRYSIS